jgi:hypothetical protein
MKSNDDWEPTMGQRVRPKRDWDEIMAGIEHERRRFGQPEALIALWDYQVDVDRLHYEWGLWVARA